jgi:hypothetical protein
MTAKFDFTRPISFTIGESYLYWERNIDGNQQTPTIVRFVDYTPCPAIVIIKNHDRRKQRCLRDDLFELTRNINPLILNNLS